MARVSVSFNNVVIVTGSLAIEESHPYVGKYSWAAISLRNRIGSHLCYTAKRFRADQIVPTV